jgi:hypothetical protein
MSDSRYEVKENAAGGSATHMVVETSTDRVLGGYGTNYFRSWIFPLYTPSGLTVVREFAFDHPFHNGIFVGQNPVRVGDRIGNFWALPIPRSHDDQIRFNIGRMDPQGTPTVEIYEDAVRFTLKSVWVDKSEEPLLDEVRTIRFHTSERATICDTTSEKTARYGDVKFAQTKFGSIGMRVEERLLPALGGGVISYRDGVLKRGSADEVANMLPCDAVAYENVLTGHGPYGVCMTILENSASPERTGPWFIRDYGMAMFNATQDESIYIAQTESWTAGLRVVAYDGALEPKRVDAWRQAQTI